MEDAEKDVLLDTLQQMARAVSTTRKLITDPCDPGLQRDADLAMEIEPR